MRGDPSSPSQQSSSTQRQPVRSTWWQMLCVIHLLCIQVQYFSLLDGSLLDVSHSYSLYNSVNIISDVHVTWLKIFNSLSLLCPSHYLVYNAVPFMTPLLASILKLSILFFNITFIHYSNLQIILSQKKTKRPESMRKLYWLSYGPLFGEVSDNVCR
jgi:hypothetical protein